MGKTVMLLCRVPLAFFKNASCCLLFVFSRFDFPHT